MVLQEILNSNSSDKRKVCFEQYFPDFPPGFADAGLHVYSYLVSCQFELRFYFFVLCSYFSGKSPVFPFVLIKVCFPYSAQQHYIILSVTSLGSVNRLYSSQSGRDHFCDGSAFPLQPLSSSHKLYLELSPPAAFLPMGTIFIFLLKESLVIRSPTRNSSPFVQNHGYQTIAM